MQVLNLGIRFKSKNNTVNNFLLTNTAIYMLSFRLNLIKLILKLVPSR